MTSSEYDRLRASVEAYGVLEPIVLLDGKILDGRHRYRAAQEVGTRCPTRVFSDVSPADLVDILNIIRRHLSVSQIAMVQAGMLDYFECEAKKRQASGLKQNRGTVKEILPERDKGQSTDKAGAAAGVSGRSVRDAKTVLAKGSDKDVQAVVSGAVSVSKKAREVREHIKRTAPPKSPKTMNRTNENIGWAQYSWNPVTGCRFGCEYCYAAAISKRYGKTFEPQIHEDRLAAPSNTKPKATDANNRVFVCSMGELFGDWVPQEWIDKVFAVVRKSPQWTFLFLTKNPKRLPSIDWPENAWVGSTIDRQVRVKPVAQAMSSVGAIRFVSCEPLLEELALGPVAEVVELIIVGAKSNGSSKVQPDAEWVERILGQARKHDCAVWFKDNLIFRPQEVPQCQTQQSE